MTLDCFANARNDGFFHGYLSHAKREMLVSMKRLRHCEEDGAKKAGLGGRWQLWRNRIGVNQ